MGRRLVVAELALDHVERDAFAREFDGMCVAQLVRRKAPPHTGTGGESPQLPSRRGV